MNMLHSRLLLWAALISLILFSCVKGYDPEPNPVFPINNFTGQWKGSLPYSSEGPVSDIRVSLAAFSNNTNLTGYMSTPDGLLIMDGQQFFNGLYFFSIRKNANCPDWSVSGSAYLINTNNLGLSFGGTFCEVHPRDIVGTMGRINLAPDTTILLTMAAVGRRLIYDITDTSGTDYQMTQEVMKELGNGVWRESVTYSNPKPASSNRIYRFITPVEYGQMPDMDSLYTDCQISFSIDARLGKTYITVTPDDSIITRVISMNTQVTVPVGTFKCVKMTKEFIPLHSGGLSGYFETWFNNNYGTIKTLQYDGDSVIMTQVLKEKNW